MNAIEVDDERRVQNALNAADIASFINCKDSKGILLL
jgi:hypothetical protein